MKSQTINQRLKKVITVFLSFGFQVEKEAFDLLKKLAQEQDIEDLMHKILKYIKKLPDKPVFITKDIIDKNISQKEPVIKSTSFGRIFKPISKEISSELEILLDPTEKICSTDKINSLIKYFQDRFTRIKKLLRERLDVKNTISVNEALNSSQNTKVKIIAMVTSIKVRRKIIFIQIEDFEAIATVLISSKANRAVREKAERLLLDQVVCIEGIKSKGDLIIATDFINPDIPERKPNAAKKNVNVALLSDLHIGSKNFQMKAFNKFLRWLKGQEGNRRQKEIASHVKYVIIAGDLVDGIGVYPDQEKELIIKDIYDQYAHSAKLIQQIPEYIEVIIIPGNHDATRQALPQQAIKKEYAEPVYQARDIVMLGNPAKIRLNSVEFLLYHGRSLDDIISSVPDIMYRNLNKTISKAMIYLLQTRHLAPIYGRKTPIALESRDYLVIDSIPDVFHAGHVHVFGYQKYKGTLIVNSGSWQSQTNFQKKMGLVPTWGIVPILNLKTLEVTPINFSF